MSTYDASNRKSIRRAEKAAELAIANRLAYLRHIMSNSPGREWMYDLLSRCSMFQTPFSPINPHVTAFNCGQQNVGLSIFAELTTHCAVEYNLMMQEQATKDQANGRRNDDDNSDRTDSATAAAGTSTDPGRDDSGPDAPSDSDDGNIDPGYYVDPNGFITATPAGRA